MKVLLRVAVLAAVSVVVACDSGSGESEPKGVIPEHQMDALDKAKGVEQMLEESSKQRNEMSED
ncbi:hypothetical protein [Pseudomaricurvus sp.]|uniref:hypothetical protein n=1 Tax=Pseudomaricurvus sp. TaxID=2004510 RepID=UPI003F6D5A1E